MDDELDDCRMDCAVAVVVVAVVLATDFVTTDVGDTVDLDQCSVSGTVFFSGVQSVGVAGCT